MFRGGTFQKAGVVTDKVEVKKEVPVDVSQEPDMAMVGQTGIVLGNGGGEVSIAASLDPRGDSAPTKPKRGRIQLPMTGKSKKKK